MKRVLKIILIITAAAGAVYAGMWIWVLVPSRSFKPPEVEIVRLDYWPTEGFRTSSPEEQGMDSNVLLKIPEFCRDKKAGNSDFSIDSISIYRNGYLVSDFYFNPLYPRESPHIINSITKSIVSVLIGIAVDRGDIISVDEPFVKYFPEKAKAVSDERMRNITIRDLLSMETGIRSRDSALYGWIGNFEMQQTDDWAAYILSLPVDAEPGERFDYSNMSTFLLSAVIEQATGTDTLDFARENLFGPLGIQDVRWDWSPQGYAVGFARMWLQPEDLGKIGLLYLQKGMWDGRQLISSSWITESVTPHAFPKNYVAVADENGEKDSELSTKNWRIANVVRPFSDGYGYQWWLDRDGSYSAVGVGGQYLMVVPEENLVAVFTSSASGMGVFFPKKVLDRYILPAIKSDGTISPDSSAYEALQAEAGPPDLHDEARPVQKLPAEAGEISGKTYKLERNNFQYDNFRLIFEPDLDYALFSYTANVNDSAEFRVGLDGTYHFSDSGTSRFAARGNWPAPDTFEIDYQQIGYSIPTGFRLTFLEDGVRIEESGAVGTHTYSGKITAIHE